MSGVMTMYRGFRSADPHRCHRDRTLHRVVENVYDITVAFRTEHVEQRQEVFGRRHGAGDVEPAFRKLGQRRVIAAHNFFAHQRIRTQREIRWRRIAKIEQTQVVHDVAAALDQHAGGAKRRKFLSQALI